MEHTLTLSVPDRIYKKLIRSANKTGQRPEELAVEGLAVVTQEKNKAESDPVEQFIGVIKSDFPDWVEHHDKYLGQMSK
jgi:hypothetical protein